MDHLDLPVQLPPGAPFERHYSVKEIAQLWALSADIVRRAFANEPGVIRLSHPEGLHKRSYCTLRVPESVMRRVHRKLTQPTSRPI
ncbi:MAG TPA: hypothetical protein VFA89_19165 [Terriglobales bacterium]|nr:hypothetical protein [Terriglobales bacterium]